MRDIFGRKRQLIIRQWCCISLASLHYTTFTFNSHLCFEKAKSSFGKHIVIPLDKITSLAKVNQSQKTNNLINFNAMSEESTREKWTYMREI